jgi:cytochrome c biogenesis protein ResB
MASHWLKRAWHFLARLDVNALLIVAVLSLTALGSCFPQRGPDAASDADTLARWEAGLSARYGPLTNLLESLGAFRFFQSPVFLGLLALLAISTLVCTLNRWRVVWRTAFRRDVRVANAVFDTAPHTANLTAAHLPSAPQLQDILERRGYQVRPAAASGTPLLRADRNRPAVAATLVAHLGTLLLLLGAALSSLLGWHETVTVGPGRPAILQHMPVMTLSYDGFAVERYPDGSPANYDAELHIAGSTGQAAQGSVRVNEPLTRDGVSVYLTGFDRSGDNVTLSLLVVHDPGYGLVVTAGFLLLVGLTVSLYFPHRWIVAWFEAEGSLRLAGQADRRASGFSDEFYGLVEELRRAPLGGVRTE